MNDADCQSVVTPPAPVADDVTRLLEDLLRLGIGLSLDGERLRLTAARGVVDEALQRRLVDHKTELVRRLQQRSAPPAPALIEPSPQDDHRPFPLSDLQLGFYAANDPHMEYHVRPHAYLETDGGAFDVAAYEAAWNAALRRHRRELCVVNAEVALQTLADPEPVRCQVYDLRDLALDEVQARLEAVRAEMMRQELPLDRWPWFDLRVSLWRDAEGERTRIHYNHNSYFIDGFGTSQLMAEIERRCREPGFDPPPPALSYRDAVLGLERMAASAQGQAARAYWFDRLPSLPAPPELPQKPGMDRRVRSRLERREGMLDPVRWEAFKARAGRHGLTPSNALIAAYACVVSAWSGNDSFILSQMVTRRLTELHPDITGLLGNFASLYPLEVHLRAVSFVENARALQERVLEDMRHLAFGGMQVLQQLNRLKGTFGSAPSPFVIGSGLFMKRYRKADFCVLETSQTLLDHQFFELDDGCLYYVWDLLEEFFPAGMIDAAWAAYEALLHDLADAEGTWLEVRRDFLLARDRAARDGRNATHVDVPAYRLHEPLAAQAAIRPQAAVLVSGQGVLDYQTLDGWSDAVASQLAAQGVRPGDRVAVLLDRAPELVAAVFGVLKTGAAYVPLDPGLPGERLAFVLSDIGGRVAIAAPSVAARADWPADVVALVVPPRGSRPATGWQSAEGSHADLAYVIYTSGSTGRPKGVMIDHRGAVNTIDDINRRFAVGPGDKVFGVSAFNFDLSVYDLFGVVAAGATLVYPDPASALDPVHILEWMAREAVTVWNSVPALMSLLAEAALSRGARLPALRLVMLSGDKIPLELPAAIRSIAPSAQVVSLGGATEASIWSIYYPVETVDPAWTTVPYGYPLDNQSWQVRDRHGRHCPTWVPGELWIGGIGLALGYWNDEEKTRSAFVRDPVSGERLYRTGDIGRYLPDGCIEWMGRADFQVKVNGHRIELGEIESVLASHPDVAQAVVTVQQRAGGAPRLVAHVCRAPGSSAQPQEFQAFLSRTLPAYMVPAAWRDLAAMPLTPNGKVDRKALSNADLASEAAHQQPSRPFAAPSTPAETRLQHLWQKLLRRAEPISVDDDFFDLGGQSFDAIRIFAAIKDEFGRAFTLGDLWRMRTIRELARALTTAADTPPSGELVRLNSVSVGHPLFLVHPAGGSVLGYMPLARLLRRPVHGLQAPPVAPDEPPQGIEDRAARYVAMLRQAQPQGPYALGGWSSGALVAYEMAAQLEAAGETVSQLAVLDGPTPQPQLAPSDDALLAWFIQDLDLGLPAERLKGQRFTGLALHEQLRKAAPLLGATADLGFDLEDLAPALGVFRVIVLAGCRYRPPRVQAPLTVVRVELDVVDEFASHPALARPDWGWGEFASGPIHCLRVPGHHHSFLSEPLVPAWHAALDADAEPRPPAERS
jgi:amino acid adenylation domain-containing protein